jgi:hypothetical protein
MTGVDFVIARTYMAGPDCDVGIAKREGIL